jgi:hypothetical protein
MKLKHVATVKTNLEDADFWLVRRGSVETVGQPVREFSEYHIGIKVNRTDLLLPDYLYYVFMHIHSTGYWERLANGTLSLVHITVSDVANIELSPS